MQDAARSLLKVAQMYQRKKWFRTSYPLLQTIQGISPRVGERERATALEKGGALPFADRSTMELWFKDGSSFLGGGYWKVADGEVTSPAIGTRTVAYHSKKRLSGSYRFSMEVMASAPMGARAADPAQWTPRPSMSRSQIARSSTGNGVASAPAGSSREGTRVRARPRP